MSSNRPAVRWAIYPTLKGDVMGQVLGPNTFGEYLTVVEQDGTRVGFSYEQTGDRDQAYAESVAQFVARLQHPAFFGGNDE